jgi:hypothetical protein
MNKNRKSLVDAMSNEKTKSIATVISVNKIAGEKKIIFTVSEEAHYQLKKLALEERSQIQTLTKEALNDLFIKYKVPPIA